MTRHTGKDNYGKPKVEYLLKISELDEEKLYKETKDKIWLSAYASNNPRSDYHWHCDACYDEILKRDGNSDRYSRAWTEVSEG